MNITATNSDCAQWLVTRKYIGEKAILVCNGTVNRYKNCKNPTVYNKLPDTIKIILSILKLPK